VTFSGTDLPAVAQLNSVRCIVKPEMKNRLLRRNSNAVPVVQNIPDIFIHQETAPTNVIAPSTGQRNGRASTACRSSKDLRFRRREETKHPSSWQSKAMKMDVRISVEMGSFASQLRLHIVGMSCESFFTLFVHESGEDHAIYVWIRL
jgi:hypothetical protein